MARLTAKEVISSCRGGDRKTDLAGLSDSSNQFEVVQKADEYLDLVNCKPLIHTRDFWGSGGVEIPDVNIKSRLWDIVNDDVSHKEVMKSVSTA